MKSAPEPRRIDSWQVAEANAAAWMRYWGYVDAQVTTAGPDGGVDVRAGRALAQVKFEAAQVGTPALQRLVGARGRQLDQRLLFFSGAGFSAPAVVYAEEMEIALFQYGLDGSMVSRSTASEELLARVHDVPGASLNRGLPSSATVRPGGAAAVNDAVDVFSLPDVVRLIRSGRRDEAVRTYQRLTGVPAKVARRTVATSWAPVMLTPESRLRR